MASQKRRKKRFNKLGIFVFFCTLAAGAFISTQWFVFVLNPTPAGGTTTNNIVIQQDASSGDCLSASLCSAFIEKESRSLTVNVPILMYHHIRYVHAGLNAREIYYSISPERFHWQMERLRENGYTPISLEAFWQALKTGPGDLPDRPVLLTFDDGHRSHFETAYPVLKEMHFPATFLIYTDGMALNGYMNEEMIRELADDPRMSIGSHTLTHSALTRLGAEGRRKEMGESKAILESITEQPVTVFSYPYGALNASIKREVKEAGYDMGFQIGPGTKHKYDGRFGIQRIQVLSWDDPARLIQKYSSR